jgi:hypothetical protein
MQSGGCEMLGIVQLCGSQIRCHGVASALELLRHLDSLSERGSYLPVLMRAGNRPLYRNLVRRLANGWTWISISAGSPLSGLALPHRSR